MKTIIHRNDDGTVIGIEDDVLYRGTPRTMTMADLTVTIDEDDDTISETLSWQDTVIAQGTYTKSQLGWLVKDGEYQQDEETRDRILDELRQPVRKGDSVVTVYEWEAA